MVALNLQAHAAGDTWTWHCLRAEDQRRPTLIDSVVVVPSSLQADTACHVSLQNTLADHAVVVGDLPASCVPRGHDGPAPAGRPSAEPGARRATEADNWPRLGHEVPPQRTRAYQRALRCIFCRAAVDPGRIVANATASPLRRCVAVCLCAVVVVFIFHTDCFLVRQGASFAFFLCLLLL